ARTSRDGTFELPISALDNLTLWVEHAKMGAAVVNVQAGMSAALQVVLTPTVSLDVLVGKEGAQVIAASAPPLGEPKPRRAVDLGAEAEEWICPTEVGQRIEARKHAPFRNSTDLKPFATKFFRPASEQGLPVFPALPRGWYWVTISKAGYDPITLH